MIILRWGNTHYISPLGTARRGGGQDFALFTDSQAAMGRMAGDAPGPGQEIAVGAISLAQRLRAQGNTITLRWAPAHRGVE